MSSPSRDLPALTEAQCDAIIEDLDASLPRLRDVLTRICVGLPVFAVLVAICSVIGFQFSNAQPPGDRQYWALVIWNALVGAGVVAFSLIVVTLVACACHWLGSRALSLIGR